MSATYQRDLEYSEILNFHKVINESPYHDKNGKKTVVLCSKFLKHFYKSLLFTLLFFYFTFSITEIDYSSQVGRFGE